MNKILLLLFFTMLFGQLFGQSDNYIQHEKNAYTNFSDSLHNASNYYFMNDYCDKKSTQENCWFFGLIMEDVQDYSLVHTSVLRFFYFPSKGTSDIDVKFYDLKPKIINGYCVWSYVDSNLVIKIKYKEVETAFGYQYHDLRIQNIKNNLLYGPSSIYISEEDYYK